MSNLWQKTKFGALLLGCAALFPAGFASAQSTAPTSPTASSNWSSSQAMPPSSQLQLAEGATPANPAALPSAPAPARAAQDQSQDQTYSGWHGSDIVHRMTIEVGGGASGPAGDKADITWGGQFMGGVGVNINRSLAAFLEFQFLSNKLPGAVAAEAGSQGGHYHIVSFTVEPVYDLFPKASNDVYLRGGGGYYHKSINFTDPTQSCGFFYYYYSCGTTNQVVGSFTSNNGGWDIGGGYQHRFGGMYGQSRTRVFAEVRYLDVLSPALKSVAPAGSGLSPVNIDAGTKLMPITLGVRW